MGKGLNTGLWRQVGKKVERMVELKDGKRVEHWVVSLAAKMDVCWVV